MISSIPMGINKQSFPKSTLYIIATPIGNIYDITLRALHVLEISNTIICENIKHTMKLLNFYNLKNNLIKLNKFNENKNIFFIINKLKNGERISLISDSGTPTISDPGSKLVKVAYENNIIVTPIPGVSAAITALSVSGLVNNQFRFVGFLPNLKKHREYILKKIKYDMATLIFYESPHRIKKTIQILINFFDNERIIIFAKELTKIYENIYKCKLKKAIKWIEKSKYNEKGEFVILLESPLIKKNTFKYKKILKVLLNELSVKKSVEITYNITKNKKKDIYKYAIKIKNK